MLFLIKKSPLSPRQHQFQALECLQLKKATLEKLSPQLEEVSLAASTNPLTIWSSHLYNKLQAPLPPASSKCHCLQLSRLISKDHLELICSSFTSLTNGTTLTFSIISHSRELARYFQCVSWPIKKKEGAEASASSATKNLTKQLKQSNESTAGRSWVRDWRWSSSKGVHRSLSKSRCWAAGVAARQVKGRVAQMLSNKFWNLTDSGTKLKIWALVNVVLVLD